MKPLRLAPWIIAFSIARVLVNHYVKIDKQDRKDAIKAIKKGRGLHHDDREHLRRVARQVNKKSLAYDLGKTVIPLPSKRKKNKSSK